MRGPLDQREWGCQRILEDNPDYKVKELILYPGKSLPNKEYQLNKHWFILFGKCEIDTVYYGSLQTITVTQGHSYEIGAGVSHSAINISDGECHILEVRYNPERKQ